MFEQRRFAAIRKAIDENLIKENDIFLKGQFKLNVAKTVGWALLGGVSVPKRIVVAVCPDKLVMFVEEAGALLSSYKGLFVIEKDSIEKIDVSNKKRRVDVSIKMLDDDKVVRLALKPFLKTDAPDQAISALNALQPSNN